jgi:hypothetical protein
MWEDLSKSVKAQLYERANSPLFGALLLAWCGWNYKIIFILLTKGDPEKKLAYIDAFLYSTNYQIYGNGILFPIGTALAYIYVYPFLAKYPYAYAQKKQKELKEIQQKIEDETPLTQEDARDLRNQLRQAATEFDKVLSEKEKQNQELIAQNIQLQTQLDSSNVATAIKKPNPVYPPVLTDIQITMLNRLAEAADNGIDRSTLMQIGGEDQIAAEAKIEKLMEYQYIWQGHRATGPFLKITNTGRERFLEEREKLKN